MRKNFLQLLFVFISLKVMATETPPFYVSKVSASGAYASAHFKTLWDAFRQEYSISSEGIFTPYYFTEHVLESTHQNEQRRDGYDLFFQLFSDQEKDENFQHLTGSQNANRVSNKFVSNQLAMEGARSYGARIVSIAVGSETSSPGVYFCDLNEALPNSSDARSKTERTPVNSGSNYTIVFCDPKNPRIGRTNVYVETNNSGRKITIRPDVPSNAMREVGSILDSKFNQDNFLSALKAGSVFKVFWFKETTCTNCGGLGRLSTLAVNQSGGSGRKNNPFGSDRSNDTSSILSLTPGVSTARDKCPACYGTGKRMRGFITSLLWDDKGPSFSPAR
jgi:hypothetical protein